MKKTLWYRVLALVLTLVLTLSITSCGSNVETQVPAAKPVENTPYISAETVKEDAAESTSTELIESEKVEPPEEVPETELLVDEESPGISEAELQKAEELDLRAEEEAQIKAEEEKKLAEQRNSFSMMFYLAITAEEIRTSKDNRLVLDDIYTSLLNDINPGAIDEITQVT